MAGKVLATAADALHTVAQATHDSNDPRYMYPSKFATQSQDVPGKEHLMNTQPDFGKDSYVGANKLVGKVALITGGDSGIGRAVAWAYAKEGADIAIQYHPSEQQDAQEISDLITQLGRKTLLLPADFLDQTTHTKIVDDTVATFGKLDILVCNAAFQGKSVQDFAAEGDETKAFTYERVNKTFQVNIISMFMTVKRAVQIMKPGSSIICTASTNAYSPMDIVLDYAATKAAIVAFVQGLSKQVITRGIRINTVAPGPVLTPIQEGSFPPTMSSTIGSETPYGRAGQPVECAGAFVFFADNKASSYTTGMVLGVTGGMLLA